MLWGVVKKEGRNEKQIEGGTTGTRGGEWYLWLKVERREARKEIR